MDGTRPGGGSATGRRVVAIVGPTAAGKTALGVELALRLGGEVVNVDSMQLYRGMDIGTAKATPAERRGVPHHLLDVWDVTHTADVAGYQLMGREVIDRLLAEGRPPVLVGGSGLYVRALLDDLSFPGTDPMIRARLEADLAAVGPAALHARLAERAPVAATAILPSNGRRIVRALEVVELTGSFTATMPDHVSSRYDVAMVGLDPPDLDERIEARVDRMWSDGFVDEVIRLVDVGLRDGRTASRALGYAQVLDALSGVLPSMAVARSDTMTATRRFARRQRSWFRRDRRVTWLDRPDADRAMSVVAPP
ncbi:MAG: tRNA (adenosine(37)-N6)-dimethylallyltransferase MiaA [Frankia sp.]